MRPGKAGTSDKDSRIGNIDGLQARFARPYIPLFFAGPQSAGRQNFPPEQPQIRCAIRVTDRPLSRKAYRYRPCATL